MKRLSEAERAIRESDKRYLEFQQGLIEPIWYLRSIPYVEYLASHHWRRRKASFIATYGSNPQCDLCGIRGVCDGDGTRLDWLPKFHVHHVSYAHIGTEVDSDLRLLCSSCHNLVHFPDSAAARFWREHSGGFDEETLSALRPPELHEVIQEEEFA